LKGDNLFRTKDCLFKGDIEIIPEVISFGRTLLSLAAEAAPKKIAKNIFKDIAEPCAAAERTLVCANPSAVP